MFQVSSHGFFIFFRNDISWILWEAHNFIFSLLNWHSQLVKITGDGAMVRVLTDRRRLWLVKYFCERRFWLVKSKNRKKLFLRPKLQSKKNFLASHKFIPRDFIPKSWRDVINRNVMSSSLGPSLRQNTDYSHGILLDK